MSDTKYLWGIPIVESAAMPKGEVILGPMPTAEDVMRYGSFEKAVQAMADQYAKIKFLSTDEIE